LPERDEITQVRARVALGADQILLADADHEARVWLRQVVAGKFGLDEVDTGEAALTRLAAGTARIVIIGRWLRDMRGEELVAEVDDTRIPVFYRLVRGMEPRRVCELLAQAAARLPPPPPREPDPELAALVAEHARAIGAEAEPDAAARAAIAAVVQLIGADRARCLYCNDESGQVWSGAEADDAESSVTSGIAGFAVRTLSGVAVPQAADDALYRREIDDPAGTGRERLAAQPVAGPDGHVHAVLIALREPHRPPFNHDELAWAPYIMQLSMRIEADEIIGDRLDRGPSDIFRQEAIMNLVRRGQRGDVVRVHPGWVRAAYWLVLISLAAAITYAALAHVHEYAAGAAVVQFTGRRELLAHEAGTIASLEVVRGQRVARGQVLARLHDAEQVGQLRTLETEFESKLVAYLQSSADPSVKQALGAIRSQRDSARVSVESRTIRAPADGFVKEVLVRNGQRVEPGSVVLSIVENPAEEGLQVIAFLPGDQRPRLQPHQPFRLTLPGYRDVHITSEVRAISEVLGAAEARARFVGDRIGDSLQLAGTVVAVEARLTSPEFESDGKKFQLHDGMIGRVEVQMQSRSLLQSLIPGLH
jgi:multidrug efflux pump subunit AcrA (membrane-fusion protein)